MNNDSKYREYQKLNLMKWFLILLAISVMILEILALFNIISCLWGIIPFILFYILKRIFLDKKSKKVAKKV